MRKTKQVQEETDAKQVIKDLADAYGDSNEAQGEMVQLLKGLAFSDEPEANEFMKALDKWTSQQSKKMFKESNKTSKRPRYKVIELSQSLKIGDYLLEKGDRIAVPLQEQMDEIGVAVPRANVQDVQEYLDNIGVMYREESESNDYYKHIDMILDFDDAMADIDDTITELEDFYSVKTYETLGVI